MQAGLWVAADSALPKHMHSVPRSPAGVGGLQVACYLEASASRLDLMQQLQQAWYSTCRTCSTPVFVST